MSFYLAQFQGDGGIESSGLRKSCTNPLTSMDTLIERLQNRGLWDTDEDANSAETFSQELIALQSIYEPHNVDLVYGSQAGHPIVLQVKMPLPDNNNDMVKLQVELPNNYPNSDTAPKMKLVNRVINGHSVDEQIRSEIDGTFTPSDSVPWSRNTPILFQGIDCAYESIKNWLLIQSKATEVNTRNQASSSSTCTSSVPPPICDFSNLAHSDVIVERKSEFVGHAIRISSPDEVCTP